MRASQTEQIDGHYYRVTPLGARAGAKLGKRIAKALGSLAAGSSAGKAALDEGGLARLAEAVSDEDLDFVLQTLASCTELSGDGAKWSPLSACWDLHFSGSYGSMLRWASFALKVNFPDFIAAFERSTTEPAPGA